MDYFRIPCYPCDKELFPGAQSSPDDQRVESTFYNDFKIGEMYGYAGVVDTFRRAFRSWKSDIKYLTELAVVTNQLGWEHYQHDNKLSKFYFDSYNKCCAYVYQADKDGNNVGPFTDEQVVFFHNVLD